MTNYPQNIIHFLPSHLSLDMLINKAKSKRKSNTQKSKPCFSLYSPIYKNNRVQDKKKIPITFKRISKI
jgi:hypothetical protein